MHDGGETDLAVTALEPASPRSVGAEAPACTAPRWGLTRDGCHMGTGKRAPRSPSGHRLNAGPLPKSGGWKPPLTDLRALTCEMSDFTETPEAGHGEGRSPTPTCPGTIASYNSVSTHPAAGAPPVLRRPRKRRQPPSIVGPSVHRTVGHGPEAAGLPRGAGTRPSSAAGSWVCAVLRHGPPGPPCWTPSSWTDTLTPLNSSEGSFARVARRCVFVSSV